MGKQLVLKTSHHLFASYFSSRCVAELDGIFSKQWSLVLYLRYNEKKTGSSFVSDKDIRAVAGYNIFYTIIPSLITVPYPIISMYTDPISLKNRYQLTKFGRWFADIIWNIADKISIADNQKTLTEILEEKIKMLKMTIEEINSIGAEEKERDDIHQKIMDMNDKISLDSPMPQLPQKKEEEVK